MMSEPDETAGGEMAADAEADAEPDAEVVDLLDDDDLLEAAAVAEGAPGRAQADAAAERDEFKDALQRLKAEFDNFRKRTAREQMELVSKANVDLAAKLLPVLDACDAAIGHGSEDVEPIFKSLLDVLGKEGLVRMDPTGEPFDPNLHEAVMHEDGDGSAQVVIETMRIGYSWSGQVLRAPMVKVRG